MKDAEGGARPESLPVTHDEPPGAAAEVKSELIEAILEAPSAEAPRDLPATSMRTARLASVSGRKATIVARGAPRPVEAIIAPEVDPALIADALAEGQSVLVESTPGEAPLIVGVLLTRRPEVLRLRGRTVEVDGDEELVLRSGRGAVRIRSDGDIEVIGSRISAASRGLFRIVGRLLRLN